MSKSQKPPKPLSSTSAQQKKRRRQGQRLTAEQRRAAQDAFLDAFATSANLRAAAKVAGIDRNMVYYWQEHDEAFNFRYAQAEADANDVIRAAIYTRAVNGVQKPLHYQGRLVTDQYGRPVTVTEYSDTLLIFLAKARMPSEFRERASLDLTSGGHSLMEDLALTLARLRAAVTDGGMPAITDGNNHDGTRDPTH